MTTIKTSITTKKELVLEEDELENILQEFGARVLGCPKDDVQVHFEVSSGGFVKTVELTCEHTKTGE